MSPISSSSPDISLDIEMQEVQGLLASGNDATVQKPHSRGKAGPKQSGGFLERLDERVNVKVLSRVWGPRLEFVVRLMLVSAFLDDSFRTATHFAELTEQVGEQGCLKWLAVPALVTFASTVALIFGVLTQVRNSGRPRLLLPFASICRIFCC